MGDFSGLLGTFSGFKGRFFRFIGNLFRPYPQEEVNFFNDKSGRCQKRAKANLLGV